MSHLVDIKTAITDLNALVKALEKLGWKGKLQVNEHTAMQMADYWGNKSQKRAHVIIPRQYAGHADVGFEKTKDGTYVLRLDNYDEHKFNDVWLQKVTQWYGCEKAKAELDIKGLKYTEEVTEEEEPRLRVRLL